MVNLHCLWQSCGSSRIWRSFYSHMVCTIISGWCGWALAISPVCSMLKVVDSRRFKKNKRLKVFSYRTPRFFAFLCKNFNSKKLTPLFFRQHSQNQESRDLMSILNRYNQFKTHKKPILLPRMPKVSISVVTLQNLLIYPTNIWNNISKSVQCVSNWRLYLVIEIEQKSTTWRPCCWKSWSPSLTKTTQDKSCHFYCRFSTSRQKGCAGSHARRP